MVPPTADSPGAASPSCSIAENPWVIATVRTASIFSHVSMDTDVEELRCRWWNRIHTPAAPTRENCGLKPHFERAPTEGTSAGEQPVHPLKPRFMRPATSLLVTSVLALTIGVSTAAAQAVPAPSSVPGPVIVLVPPAAPSDVESIDAIITALYDVISGPAGQPRNWNRMRSLFIPGGRLMPTGTRQGTKTMRVLEVNDYIALSGPQLERTGFRERELARRTEQFGHIAHVFSTYEGRAEAEGMAVRGINSIQLMNDGTRWWVVSVLWEAERPETPLPAKYLQPGS